jgi:hypothetical protein
MFRKEVSGRSSGEFQKQRRKGSGGKDYLANKQGVFKLKTFKNLLALLIVWRNPSARKTKRNEQLGGRAADQKSVPYPAVQTDQAFRESRHGEHKMGTLSQWVNSPMDWRPCVFGKTEGL